MTMRRSAILALCLLAIAAPTALAADPPTPAFGGPLSGAQEVPAVATAAVGEATVVISPDDSTIWYVVTYSGLSGTLAAAHIHTGASGANGGVILPLVASASPMVGTLTAANFSSSGSVTTFAQAVAAIKAGTTYVNLHTAANPGGEIRGQVVAKGSAHFATLSGAQEVPAVSTAASGSAWVVVSTGGATLTYYVAFSGLSGAPAAAHIHLGAVGANGGVLLPLVAGASPMTGTLSSSSLTPTGSVTDLAGAVAAIAAGGTYINVHTAAHPGGELRGQLAETVAAPAPAPTANPTLPPTSTDASVRGSSAAGGSPIAIVLLGLAAAALVLGWSRRMRIGLAAQDDRTELPDRV
ncbi:MAG TPA: CHRD domain-containing protein [Candidatus Sulfomarinibacteraceae bacterium]|nr:CHRD domain-containing protein [Candidatus Sulfomarinibacteraceae bacterium]